MARIKNINSPPGLPVTWVSSTGHRVPWKTTTEPFAQWMQRVWAYCDGNKIDRPSEDDLHNVACRQFPSWACDGTRQTMNIANRSMGGEPGQVQVRRCGGCGR